MVRRTFRDHALAIMNGLNIPLDVSEKDERWMLKVNCPINGGSSHYKAWRQAAREFTAERERLRRFTGVTRRS